MKIKKLKISHFGQFSHRTLELADGINLITGGNESGKSTVHTFIRSMLFGMHRGRGRASRNDTFSRCEPWENPAYYAGELEFESGGKDFRLVRNFARGDQQTELVCLTDGEVLSVEDGDLDVLLGGVSEAVYDNTVSIGQLQGKTGEALAEELRDYMANYEGGDGSLDVTAALENLQRKKKELEAARREQMQEQARQEMELTARIQVQEEECRRSEQELEDARDQLRKAIFGKDVPPSEVRKARDRSMRGHRWTIACAAIAVLLIVVCVLQFFKVSSYLVRAGLAVAVLALIYLAARMLHHHQEETSVSADTEEQKLRKMTWNTEYMEKELQQKRTMLDNLQTEREERREAAAGQEPYEEELAAVSLASETIREIAGSLQMRLGQSMQERMSDILRQLSGGRYQKVSVDEKLQIFLQTDDRFLPLQKVSRGTMEQAWFALRMGAMEVLCGEEIFPVLLDEEFALYDQERLAAALRWLSGQERQALIFTCQDREERILDELGLPYHRIAL